VRAVEGGGVLIIAAKSGGVPGIEPGVMLGPWNQTVVGVDFLLLTPLLIHTSLYLSVSLSTFTGSMMIPDKLTRLDFPARFLFSR